MKTFLVAGLAAGNLPDVGENNGLPSFIVWGAIAATIIGIAAILVAWAGIRVLAKADKAKIGDSARTGANTLIGGALVALGLGTGVVVLTAGVLGTYFATQG